MDADDLEIEHDDCPTVHLLVAAAGQPLPETRAWPSIFDMAAAMAFGYQLEEPKGRWGRRVERVGPVPIQDQQHLQIIRSAGRVVCRRVHYLDTEAWRQQEQARRARQVLPPPPKQTFRLKRRPAARAAA